MLSRDKKGFTLVESVLAMLIAAVMLVGFLQVCTSSALMLKNIRYRMRAVHEAQAEMERVRSYGYAGLADGELPDQSFVIDEGPTTLDEDNVYGTIKTTIKDVEDDGRKIIVEVDWNILGETRRDSLESVVYSR